MAIMALAANFGKEFPECLLPIWLDLLAPYPASLVNEAVKQVILTYEYKTMPPFAVLQRELDKLSGVIPEAKALDMRAEAEWGKLLDAIGRYGSYRKPDLHKTTEYVLRSMGGWGAACQWDAARLEWRRKEFVEAWKMADGKVDLMIGGAEAIPELPQSARAILDRMLDGNTPKALA